MTGIRTPWSFQMAVIPRLRAISPVRMEFGVHFDGVSCCEFADEVATEGAFSGIEACNRRSWEMGSGRCLTNVRSPSIERKEKDYYFFLRTFK